MGRRYIPTGTPLPKALSCGILEDGGRILFLVRNEATQNKTRIERFELPAILVRSGRSPVAEIKTEFPRATGIDGEVHEIIMEGRFNAGSRKRKVWIPALGFKITAKNRTAKPAPEFSGFRWVTLDDAKKQKLGRNSEWLARR